MKRIVITSTLLLILLIVTMTDTQFVSFTKANPYSYEGFRTPPEDVELPKINFASPQNNTILAIDTIPLSFDISINTSEHILSNDVSYPNEVFYFMEFLYDISYQVDWQKGSTLVGPDSYTNDSNVTYNKTLSKIPEGKHFINVTAFAQGVFTERNYFYFFTVNTSSSIHFTIDKTPPKIMVREPLNTTYNTISVPLNFTVNEPVSWMSYCLDGQCNVTILGNTTLSDLEAGLHNVTIFATDMFGNKGTSETAYFTVAELEPQPQPEPFPTLLITISVGIAAIVTASLLIYFKKRKQISSSTKSE